MNPNYFILTLGCQMNQSDAERLSAVLESTGYQACPRAADAQLIVLNACSVRQTAIDRIWGWCRQLEEWKKQKPIKTVLTGCLLDSDRLKFQKHFDLVLNIQDEETLRAFLGKRLFEPSPKMGASSADRFCALVPIMTGCDNFCSYCVVPYARGREQSRLVAEVLREVSSLAESGCREVQLLGQNVNSYKPADEHKFCSTNPFKTPFAKLLWEINQIAGLARVHFITSHPRDMNDEVIQALTLPKQVNYLHLALQSGNNEILKKMNRQYAVEDFYRTVEKVRRVKPTIALGTDIVVGFPSETRAQFEDTLRFYQKVNFDIAYGAKYSLRPSTAAARLVDDVSLEEKKKRWQELQALMERITLEKNQAYVGRRVSVLIDKLGPDYQEGNSLEMKRTRIYGRAFSLGEIAKVTVTEAKTWLLMAGQPGVKYKI